MKVWADHQKSNGESQLKCPLCREQFSTFEMLELEYRNNSLNRVEKQDVHYGLVCNSCKSTPLVGKSYKCTQCAEFYLCQNCFNTDFHKTHSFVFREVRLGGFYFFIICLLITGPGYLEAQPKISPSHSRSCRSHPERISSRASQAGPSRRRL